MSLLGRGIAQTLGRGGIVMGWWRFWRIFHPKGEMTELALGNAGPEEGEAVAVGVGDCATRSAGVKMGTLEDKVADSGPGQNMVNWRSQVLGLLLAVVIVIGWLTATATQLTQRWLSS